MVGFNLECMNCNEIVKFDEEENNRLTKKIVVLNHKDGVRFVCTRCDYQLVLK